MKDFDIALTRHLYKCELEFRAKNLPGGSNVDWLAPHCCNVQEIASFLRYLGFRIDEIVDEVDSIGEKHQWVVTKNGIVVYVNRLGSFGFMAGRIKRPV